MLLQCDRGGVWSICLLFCYGRDLYCPILMAAGSAPEKIQSNPWRCVPTPASRGHPPRCGHKVRTGTALICCGHRHDVDLDGLEVAREVSPPPHAVPSSPTPASTELRPSERRDCSPVRSVPRPLPTDPRWSLLHFSAGRIYDQKGGDSFLMFGLALYIIIFRPAK